MSKTLDTLVQQSLESTTITGAFLVKFEFVGYPGGFLRLTNAGSNIYWDESGTGEQEYIGVGNILSISRLEETAEVGASTFQIILSGVDKAAIQEALTVDYIGKSAKIWFATIDPDTLAVEGGTTGPINICSGRMDFMNIEFGENATISVNVTSRLADWERQHGGRYTHAYQTTYVDPLDDGFKNVIQLQKMTLIWGDFNDMYATSSLHTGKCFAENTLILMKNGTFKFIQDINLAEEVLYGGKVTSIIKGLGLDMDWYLYNNTKVTGSHMVLDNIDNTWKNIEDSTLSIKTTPEKYYYCLNTEKAILISKDGDIFADLTDIPGTSSLWKAWDNATVIENNLYRDRNKELIKLRDFLKND